MGIFERITSLFIKFRASGYYVPFFIIFNVVWIGAFKLGYNHLENSEYTIINLIICIVAEISAATVLHYSITNAEQAKRLEEKLDAIEKKLEK